MYTNAMEQHTILIIDDDTFLLDMYALRFSQSGYHVDTALSAEDAFNKMKTGLKPDVLLIDIMMPGMDGFEFLEKVNADHLADSAIKVYLSNRGQASDIARSEELHADGYLIKANIIPSEVVAHVEGIMSKKKSA
jgi:CheY-like chemotaxis protein